MTEENGVVDRPNRSVAAQKQIHVRKCNFSISLTDQLLLGTSTYYSRHQLISSRQLIDYHVPPSRYHRRSRSRER
jgi:hypothetical protein